MRKYISYTRYLVTHKFYVLIECWKRGLFWRGISHDMSKFLPSEFFPYVNHFYNEDGSRKMHQDSTGYYKPTCTGDNNFDYAWFLHQKRNSHHWQWHIYPANGEGEKVLEMRDGDWKEMVCDWISAAKVQRTRGANFWYMKNKDKLRLHPETRKKVEKELSK